jgi:hypothetical protein
MTKAELESKHLAELHALAAERDVPRYRMLPRAELIEKLADGDGGAKPKSGGGRRRAAPKRERSDSASSRPKRERRPRNEGESGGKARPKPEARPEPEAKPEPAPAPPAQEAATSAEEPRPRRRRRRRRPFGRKGSREVRVADLLLPADRGRQAIVYAETRAGCTALLSEIAAQLEATPKGPDPVVVLIDPTPEELASWRRDAPRAEIVAAGQPRHADDALSQARNRAAGGDDVVLLVDSLTRLGEAADDAGAAKEFFDAGQDVSGGGSLTVVAAVEKKSA